MGSTIRVAHLAKYYAPVRGGIESHVRALAHAQAALGAEVEVVCLGHDDSPTHVEDDGPIRLTRVGRRARVGKLDVCPELPAVIRRLDADVLHVHVPNPAMILGVLLAQPRGTIVVGYHSDHVNQRLMRRAFRPLEHAFYPSVSRILTTSPSYADASDLLHRYAAKVQTLPLGIDLVSPSMDSGCIEKEAAGIQARHRAPLWFFCGRLVPYKGIRYAVRAMREAPGTLLIAGEGPERQGIAALIAELGLGDRVHLLGAVPSVRPYLRAADALWLPSINRSEAFGVVQLEAMAEGCPVLNTAIHGSGVSWVSRHEESGLTVPPGDAQALARAACRLATEEGLREKLGERALARVKEFDLSAIAARSLEIYEAVLEGARMRGGASNAGHPAVGSSG